MKNVREVFYDVGRIPRLRWVHGGGSASNGRGMMQESRQQSIMVRWSRLADKRTTIAMLVGRFASKSRQFLRNGCQTGRHYHTPWFFSSDRPWRLTLLALACDPKRCSLVHWTRSRKLKCLADVKRKCLDASVTFAISAYYRQYI